MLQDLTKGSAAAAAQVLRGNDVDAASGEDRQVLLVDVGEARRRRIPDADSLRAERPQPTRVCRRLEMVVPRRADHDTGELSPIHGWVVPDSRANGDAMGGEHARD